MVDMRRTFATGLLDRRNNFDFLRMLAATAVIFSHSWPLTTGTNNQEPLSRLGDGTIGGVAVGVFFVVSGFLVTFSLDRSATVRRYALSRALRILPGLACVVAVCALIIGPSVTDLPLGTYLSAFPFLGFIGDHLPGVFTRNPYALAVDGSLWTIKFEVLCYVILGCAGCVGLLKRRWASVALAVFFLLPVGERLTLGLGPFFFLGSLAYVYRDRIPVSGWLAAVALAVQVALSGGAYFGLALPFTTAYLALYFAFAEWPHLQNFGRWGDFSYGTYIWAFPIQQLIVGSSGGAVDPLTLFAVATPLTIGVGAASWHLVEKRALAYKNKPLIHAVS